MDDLGQLSREQDVTQIVVPDNEPLPVSFPEFCALCEKANLQVVKLGLYPNPASVVRGADVRDSAPATKPLAMTAKAGHR